jgi:phage terminase large subunit-like protein
VKRWSSDQAEEIAEALAAMEEAVRLRPTLAYRPHDFDEAGRPTGQLQFHQARHVVRAMFPGNRWGKTRAMGSEAAWWIDHAHPYQPTPSGPVIILWFCPEFRQFDILRPQLEGECLTAGWRFNDQKHLYTWPDKSLLYILSYDRSWEHVQGINPDMVCFDEEPPLKLWREMMMRRPGRRATRYCLAATATKGETWMESTIFGPWRDHHEEQGVNLADAKIVQSHPYSWVWDEGSIEDNPGVRVEDRAWVDSITWSGDAEAKVRRRGGFARFNGNPVFLQKWIDALLADAALADSERGGSRIVSVVPMEE